MPDTSSPQLLELKRDGTSQNQRTVSALAAESAVIDERTMGDWLRVAAALAKELRYFSLENQPQGSWAGLFEPGRESPLNTEAWLAMLAGFAEHPERDAEKALPEFRRPHLVLFLTFLRLLQKAQEQMNGITQRHLDFYFRTVLRQSPRLSTPDKVHVLFEPSPHAEQVLVPAGTWLDAGKDSQDNDVIYRTDRDLLVNQIGIGELRSVFVHRRVTGLKEARASHSTARDRLVAMLQIALGEPNPGDSLPPFGPNKSPVDFDEKDPSALLGLYQLASWVDGNLGDFVTLRRLLLLKDRRVSGDEWPVINGILQKAIRSKFSTDVTIDPSDRNFFPNLDKIQGGPIDFGKLKDIGIDDIYKLYHQRTRDTASKFVTDNLGFDPADFERMMQCKELIDTDWQLIQGILSEVARLRNIPFQAVNPATPQFREFFDFEAKLNWAESEFQEFKHILRSTDFAGIHAAVGDIEQAFFMSAENFVQLMRLAPPEPNSLTDNDWRKGDELLFSAYAQKVYAERRTMLLSLGRDPALVTAGAGLLNMAHRALADVFTDVKQLSSYLPGFDEKRMAALGNQGELSDEDWNYAAQQLELAWRKREGNPPVPEKAEWLSLSALADAKQAIVPGSSDPARWRTFGAASTATGADRSENTLGLAITSPLLSLAEGQRTIVLTLFLDGKQIDADRRQNLTRAMEAQNPTWRARLSTQGGWMAAPADPFFFSSSEDPLLTWTITLQPSDSAIVPLPSDGADEVNAQWPALQLSLAPRASESPDAPDGILDYSVFHGLSVKKIELVVRAKGVKNLRAMNDVGEVDVQSPFEPFGSAPVVGSGFAFGHQELVQKKLDELFLNLEWLGSPPELLSYYDSYEAVKKAATGENDAKICPFSVSVAVVEQGARYSVYDRTELFARATDKDGSITTPKDQVMEFTYFGDEMIKKNPHYRPVLQTVVSGVLQEWPRYVRLELNSPDFQHAQYPKLMMEKSIEVANAIAKNIDITASNYTINPPYTPKLKSFSIEYSSRETMDFSTYEAGREATRIAHLHPFGVAEVQPDRASGTIPLLPDYDNEGELYLGLTNVQAPQNVALLLKMAEGSANPSLQPADVAWSYLSGNRWQSLNDGLMLQDGTRGLLQSGIVEFRLPAATANTLLPAELYWLRASVQRRTASVCDTLAIHTQAVDASFIDQGDSPDHLKQPLAPNSIGKTVEPLADILAVQQPYTSFGGSPAELDSRLYRRVSERLRHKQRALNVWDYEHLVLEQFPQIYKAKCLPVAVSGDRASESNPVTIVVIPDIRQQVPFDPFEPMAPAALLAEIRGYLARLSPPFVAIQVRNARFIPVKLRFAVRFQPGCDPGYYKSKLNEEINRYLSPWAFDEGEDLVIGGRLFANGIINFIERRSYVDYVAQFKMFRGQEDGRYLEIAFPADSSIGYSVTADSSDQVLVSGRKHQIDLVSDVTYLSGDFTGIGYMEIGLDFKVA